VGESRDSVKMLGVIV